MMKGRLSDTPICVSTNTVITAEGQTKEMLLVRSEAYQTTEPVAYLPLQKRVIDSYGHRFRNIR